ncbi:hypothetical protein JCM8208_000442 [Rhodotorula glutinis]
MLGVGRLFLAPISETFGRRPMLVILTALITLLFLPQALAPNFASICATRFFQGALGSCEGPVIAGVVADLFPKRTRGMPMAVFVAAVFWGNATGPSVSAWVAYKLTWRWVYWLQMITSGVSCLLVIAFLPETRGEVLLARRAASLSPHSASSPHRFTVSERVSRFATGVKVSSTRPLVYLFTEPVVFACAMWIGAAWGVVFLWNGAISLVFKETYGWNSGQGATPLLGGAVASLIGLVEHKFIQERLYRRSMREGGGRAKPEARLYSSVGGALLFSAGSFAFAWTARSWIHPAAPIVSLVVAQTGLWIIYLATYNYLADVYERYGSSAQAAQSLMRGILGSVFPFFGNTMYLRLGFPWASTLVGFIALAFTAVPLLFIRYGPAFRARSRVAQQLEHEEGEVLRDEPAVVSA